MDTLPAICHQVPLLAAAPLRVVAQPSIFREPSQRIHRTVPHGATLLELVIDAGMGEWRDSVVHLPGHVVCTIDGDLIERRYWHRVRPAPGRLVAIHLVPQGQREAIIIGASLAIAVLAIAAPYSLGVTTPLYAALITGGIAVGGSLALTALIPPLEDEVGVYGPQATSAITGDANQLRQNALVPVVLANAVRVVPMHWARPFTEAAGVDTHWRMLLVFGQGPLSISDIKAGDTLLSANPASYDYEVREGRATEDPLTLFTQDITEVSPASTFGEVFASTPQVMTMEPGCTEGTVDITFPNGIYSAGKVNRDKYTVVFVVERSPTGAGTWTDFKTGGALEFHTHREETSNFLRFTYRTTNLNPAVTYDVRVRRTNGDGGSSNPSAMFWTALRSIQPNDPRPDKTLACIAIRAKKTGSGTVPVISAICGTYAEVWNGVVWVEGVTGNPASLGRLLLQSAQHNPNPVADARLDLPSWEDFYEWCDDEGFEFNGVFADEGVCLERVSTVLSAGRGRLIPPDTKYAVAIDRGSKAISGMITPRNSSGFKGTHFLRDPLQALRCLFINEDTWQADERLVFADGYDEDNVEDGAIETWDMTRSGTTNPDMVWRFGRWRLADAALRLDLYEVSQGIEALQHVPGDLVAFQHHAALLGLTRGRIKSILADAIFADEFATLSLDTALNGSSTWAWMWVFWNANLLGAGDGDEMFKAWSGYEPGGGGQTPAEMGVVLHEVSGGTLKLYGRVNPDPTGYGVPYLGGMINSELTQSHLYGTWEIRARFTVTKGQRWSIWLAATDQSGGVDELEIPEIDIAQITNTGTALSINRVYFGAHGVVSRIEEPWTASNGAVWPTANFNAAEVTGTSTVNVQSNAGRLLSQGAAFARARIVSKIATTNFDLRVQVTLPTGDQTAADEFHTLNFRAAGGWSSSSSTDRANGYSVRMTTFSGSRTLQLASVVNSVRTSLGSVTKAFGTSPWMLRVRAEGDLIEVKMWQGTEPAGWDIAVNHAGHVAGDLSFATANGADAVARSSLWDDLDFRGMPPSLVMHNGTLAPSAANGVASNMGFATTEEWRDWHVFKLVWTPDTIEWWVDGLKRMSCANYITVPMHLMITPQAADNWSGEPDGTTEWPSTAEIEYVRLSDAEVLAVTIDDLVTMEAGKTYAARVRLIDSSGVAQFIEQAVINDAGGTLLAEPWTGSNGAAWPTARWETSETTGTSIVDIQSNAGRVLPQGSGFESAKIVSKRGDISDFELTATFMLASSGDQAHNLNLRASAGWAASNDEYPQNGYSLRLSGFSNSFRLSSTVDGTITEFGGVVKTWGTSLWNIRVRFVGTSLRAKVWQGSEPAGWDIDESNGDHTSGLLSLGSVCDSIGTARAIAWDSLVVQSLTTATVLRFETAFATDASPQVGDLLAFGETNLATVNALVKDVVPGPNKTARIFLVDEAPAVFVADEGPIPPFTSQISLPGDFFGLAPAVPVIDTIVVRDISHPAQPDVITQQQVIVHLVAASSVLPPPTGYDVEIKRADQVIYQRRIHYPPDTVELLLENVQSDALYDVRVRATGRSPRGVPNESAWSAVRQVYVPLPQVTPALVARVARLELQGQGNDTEFVGPDAHFTWAMTATTGAAHMHALSDGELVGFVEPSFAWFEVEVIDPTAASAGPPELLWSHTIEAGDVGVGAGGGGTSLFSEAWTGSNGAAWPGARWGTADVQGTSTVTIQSNAGRLLAQGVAGARARIISTSGSLDDFELTAQVTLATGSQTAENEFHNINFRASGGWSAVNEQDRLNGYSLEFRTVGGLQRLQLSSTVNSARATLGPAIAKAWGTSAWLICIRCAGTSIKARAWQGTEPSTWDIEVTNADHAAGDISIATVNGSDGAARTATWDNLAVLSLASWDAYMQANFGGAETIAAGEIVLAPDSSPALEASWEVDDVLYGFNEICEPLLGFSVEQRQNVTWRFEIYLDPAIDYTAVADSGGSTTFAVLSFPGLVGGQTWPGANGNAYPANDDPMEGDNWSARIRVRKDGKIGPYLYVQNKPTSFGWMRVSAHPMHINDLRGRWTVWEQTCAMNTPGVADGVCRLKIDGQVIFEASDIEYRSAGFSNVGVNGMRLGATVQSVDGNVSLLDFSYWFKNPSLTSVPSFSIDRNVLGYVRRLERTTTPQFVYAIADNKEDSRGQALALGGSNRPLRRFSLRVAVVDRFGRRGPGQTITVQNPAPAVPLGLIVSGEASSLFVKCDATDDDDFEELRVYIGTGSGFDPAAASTQVERETLSNSMTRPAPTGTTVFIRAALADRFSNEVGDLNLSSEVAVTIKSPAGPPRFTADGIRFVPVAASNIVTWTAGTMYVQDGATVVSEVVAAGQAPWVSGTLWLYYIRGSGVIQATTNAALAQQPDRVALAIYKGGSRLTRTTGDIPIANIVTTGAGPSMGMTTSAANTLFSLPPIETAGNPVEITVSARVLWSATQAGGSAGHLQVDLRILRDGTSIRNVTVARADAPGSSLGVMTALWSGALTTRDVPSAGSHVYAAQVVSSGANFSQTSNSAQGISMSAIEALY